MLSTLLDGLAITYPSGLSAAFAALIHVAPSTIAITGGYLGCYESISVYRRLRPDCELIALEDDYPAGTLCWLESPVNPFGECRDIAYYAKKAHNASGTCLIDSTFAPPPLQEPFKWGVDIVMHSATKYLAGHSDTLQGVLAVKDREAWLKVRFSSFR